MSRLWSLARNLFSRPTPAAAAPAPPTAAPTPQGDLRDRARRTAEKIRTWVVAGRLSILPWLDNQTQETQEIRDHYRIMLRDGVVQSAIRTNALAVAQEPVQVHAEDEDDPVQKHVARCLQWSLKKVEGGPHGIAWNVLFSGQIDGWSLNEVVLRKETERHGVMRGKIAFQALKSKDSKFLQLQVDQFKSVVGVRSSGFGPVRVFSGPDLESFVIYSHMQLFQNPLGLSVCRAAYRPYWIKDTAWQLRALFLERQATPALMGTWSTIDQKAALEEALEEMGSRTWLTVPAGALVVPLDIAGRGGAEYKSAIDDCDREILIGITGAHLPTIEGQTTDARGDTGVQQETSQLLQWMMSESLGELITRQMAAPWVRFNWGEDVPCPTVTWGAVNEKALLLSLQIDDGFQKLGGLLGKKDTYRRYNRQEPEGPDDVLRPPGQGPAAPKPPGGPGGELGGNGLPGLPPAAPPDQEFGEFDESKVSRDRGRFSTHQGTKKQEPASKGPAKAADTVSHTVGPTPRRAILKSAGKGVVNAIGKAHHTGQAVEHVVQHFLSHGVDRQIARLPAGVRQGVAATWWLTKLGTKAAFVTYTTGQALAEETAREAGATPEQAARIRGICTALDLAGAKAVPLTLGLIGLGAAAAPASFVPAGSAAYLAYSSARRPLAVLRAARKVIASALARKKTPEAATHMGEETGAKADTARLAKRIVELGDQGEWYAALVTAALDQVGTLAEAMDVADAALAEQDEAPGPDAEVE